jgi:hypothetical protein
MEPSVEPLLLHGAPTSSDLSSRSSSGTASLFPADSSSSPDAVAVLLGDADAAAPFLSGIWEHSAWHCHASPQQQPVQAQLQQQQESPPLLQQQQTQQARQELQRATVIPGCAQNCGCSQAAVSGPQQQHGWPQQQFKQQLAGRASAGAAWLPLLSQELAVAGLFSELLAAGLHCPVMGVEETDAVQVGAFASVFPNTSSLQCTVGCC